MISNHPNSIKKSLRLLQVEKMVIILKELEHMKTILDFFNGYTNYEKKDKIDPNQNKPIKKNIAYLRYDIRSLEKEICQLQDISNGLKNTESMLFVIQYDYIRTQIEDMLRVIQTLYNKMRQLFGETLNQYLPYPVLGRRYSNNGIMMYLGNYYREMLKTFSPNHSNKLMLGWNYRTGFQYRVFMNRELQRKNYKVDTYNDYIDLPYWYYELPILLPSITHEVVYIALRDPTPEIKVPYEALDVMLKDFFDDTSNGFVQKVQDILAYETYATDLAKVIFCDVASYKTHGNAYIHALFHDILGEKLAKDYLTIIHHGKEKGKSFKITSNEWYFIQKKDHSILRLHFLLHLLQEENEEDADYLSMLEMLNALMPLNIEDIENTKEIQGSIGFSKIYMHNYPNLKGSYLSVQNYLAQVLIVLKQWELTNREKIKAIKTPDNSPRFDELWNARYEVQQNLGMVKTLEDKKDVVIHQNMFRRLIHTDISNIKYLKDNEKKIEKNELSIIYLLELGKARKDISNPHKHSINELIKKEINRNAKQIGEEDTVALSVYGIYDWLTIKKKTATFDISKKFQELLDRTNDDEPNIDDLKYFKSKQVLMKVHEGIEGKNKNEVNQFSVIFNIEISKRINNKECSNGYNDLNQAIDNLAIKLQRNKHFFQYVDIYKSLGPKDITVMVQNLSSLDAVFKLLEEINQQKDYKSDKHNGGKILRTFTMLCSNFGEEPVLEKGFSLISYLRISNKFRESDVSELIDKTLMLRVTEITGVMDFRIVWRPNAKISDILEFYNQMTIKAHLTDFQTKVEKVIHYEYTDLEEKL